MHTHFDQHLNIRKIILDKKPKVIVECGAGNGECTRLLAHLHQAYPFELYSITDKALDGIEGVQWKIGLSYKRLAEFPDNSIDLCIIDTDHNFWTLEEELHAVRLKMKEGGLILFHDVEEFYHNTGMAAAYWDGEPYPEKEIMECVKFGGVGDALLKFLVRHNHEYKLVRWLPENYGAAVIERKTIDKTLVIKPGGSPVFAPPRP